MSEEKRILLQEDSALRKKLEAVPGIVFTDQAAALPSSFLSLKKLFSRDNMDRFHVDSLILKKIALSMLKVMMGLSDQEIYPGLYDMEDILTDVESRDYRVAVLHPERFQLGQYEQEYDWYPEDQRRFPNLEYFDEKTQKKADRRLLYRILIGSARGNVKFPPARSEADYAELFYNILPDSWKLQMEEDEDVDYPVMEEELRRAIAQEEEYARQIAKTDWEQVLPPETEHPEIPEESGPEERKTLSVLFLMMPAEPGPSDDMGRLLYELQDELELEALFHHRRLRLCAVCGDETIRVQPFCEYPPFFRYEVPFFFREYSAGEAMLIAAGLLKREMEEESDDGEKEYRVYFLLDGRINNDKMFRAGAAKLCSLQDQSLVFGIRSRNDVNCEACEHLKSIVEESRR